MTTEFQRIAQACIHCGYQLEGRFRPGYFGQPEYRHQHNKRKRCEIKVTACPPNRAAAWKVLSQ